MAIAFFMVPMKRDDNLFGQDIPARHCGMNDFSEEITAAGGYWEEAEMDGNQAIVRLRAREPIVNSVGRAYTRLSETEARSLWTPTRKAPQYNQRTDKIEFLQAERHACKTLDELVRRVPEGAASIEVVALLGLWGAVGFSQGWRLPVAWCQWLAEHGIAPGGLWFETLVRALFDQHGAFPTTPLLDNFNRADENPLANGNWTGPWFGSEDDLQIVSNVVSGGDTVPSNSYWSAATFGPDTEVHVNVATEPASGQSVMVAVRITTPGASVDGYSILHVQAGPDFFRYFRIDNSVPTALGADVDITLTSGDDMGLQITGSTLTGQYDSGSGWTAIATRSDATYSAVGNIGFRLTNTTARADNFGGGTFISFLSRAYPRGANRGVMRGVA